MNLATLKCAARAAILHGNTIAGINPAAWAATYHCGTEDVRAAWELALAEMGPTNAYEVDGK